MKPWRYRRPACAAAFALVCALVLAFVHHLTTFDYQIAMLEWENAVFTAEDGNEVPLPLDESGNLRNSLPVWTGGTYTFTARTGPLAAGCYLQFNVWDGEAACRLDGKPVYAMNIGQPAGSINCNQLRVPLPPSETGLAVELTYRYTDIENVGVFPPLVTVVDPQRSDAAANAYANRTAIPAGALLLAFVILCGLFLLQLAMGQPDFTLLVLAGAAVAAVLPMLALAFGGQFLPAALADALSELLLSLLTPALILLYLFCKRKTMQLYFVWVNEALALVLLFIGGGLLLQSSAFLQRFPAPLMAGLQSGSIRSFSHWLTLYLLLACTATALYRHVTSYAAARSEASALRLEQKLAQRNYDAIERGLRATAAVRHEWKNDVTALHLLYEQGKIDEVGACLDRLYAQTETLPPMQFTEHYVLNVLLRDAAVKAAADGIRFEASVLVPPQLAIADSDLCSLLLNMLDNALEACRALPEGRPRRISFHAELKNGFLAVSCRNTCDPAALPPAGEDGLLPTGKADKRAHGFGLPQMQRIAKKYHSLLDISCEGDVFTVQTALRNVKEREENDVQDRRL